MTFANIRVLLCHDHEVLRSGLANLPKHRFVTHETIRIDAA